MRKHWKTRGKSTYVGDGWVSNPAGAGYGECQGDRSERTGSNEGLRRGEADTGGAIEADLLKADGDSE